MPLVGPYSFCSPPFIGIVVIICLGQDLETYRTGISLVIINGCTPFAFVVPLAVQVPAAFGFVLSPETTSTTDHSRVRQDVKTFVNYTYLYGVLMPFYFSPCNIQLLQLFVILFKNIQESTLKDGSLNSVCVLYGITVNRTCDY